MTPEKTATALLFGSPDYVVNHPHFRFIPPPELIAGPITHTDLVQRLDEDAVLRARAEAWLKDR